MEIESAEAPGARDRARNGSETYGTGRSAESFRGGRQETGPDSVISIYKFIYNLI